VENQFSSNVPSMWRCSSSFGQTAYETLHCANPLLELVLEIPKRLAGFAFLRNPIPEQTISGSAAPTAAIK